MSGTTERIDLGRRPLLGESDPLNLSHSSLYRPRRGIPRRAPDVPGGGRSVWEQGSGRSKVRERRERVAADSFLRGARGREREVAVSTHRVSVPF